MEKLAKATSAYIWTQLTLDILAFAIRVALLAGAIRLIMPILGKAGLF